MNTLRHLLRSPFAVVVFASTLWIVGGASRSLWIDELHSLQHARQPALDAFFASVADDNHPPLAWLLLRGALALFGDGELAMRSWAIAIGLAFLALTARVARGLPDAAARTWAPWLVALSSYTFMVATEARMYGLLALATLGLVDAVLRAMRGERGAWLAAPWIAVGLHSHYYFVHDLFVVGAAVLALAILDARWRAGAKRLLLPVLVGGLAFLPWGLTGFAEQLAHDLPSGGWSGRYANAQGYAQSIAHLFFMNTSVGGAWVSKWLALPGSALALFALLLGARRLYATRATRDTPTLTLLVAVGLLAPLWALAVSLVYERAGFNWRYVAGSLGPVLLLASCGVAWRPGHRAALSAGLIGTMALATLLQVTAPGQEDYRGAIRLVVERARPGDAIVTRPQHFVNPDEALTGWDYYAPRMAAELGIDPSDLPATYDQDAVEGALAHDRVWVVVRRRFSPAAFEALMAAYPRHEIVEVGNVMKVHRFER